MYISLHSLVYSLSRTAQVQDSENKNNINLYDKNIYNVVLVKIVIILFVQYCCEVRYSPRD